MNWNICALLTWHKTSLNLFCTLASHCLRKLFDLSKQTKIEPITSGIKKRNAKCKHRKLSIFKQKQEKAIFFFTYVSVICRLSQYCFVLVIESVVGTSLQHNLESNLTFSDLYQNLSFPNHACVTESSSSNTTSWFCLGQLMCVLLWKELSNWWKMLCKESDFWHN